MAPTGHIAVWTILSCQLVCTEISPLNVVSHQKLCQVSDISLARECLTSSVFTIHCQVNIKFILRINLWRLFWGPLAISTKACLYKAFFKTNFSYFLWEFFSCFPRDMAPLRLTQDRARDSIWYRTSRCLLPLLSFDKRNREWGHEKDKRTSH